MLPTSHGAIGIQLATLEAHRLTASGSAHYHKRLTVKYHMMALKQDIHTHTLW